MGATTSSPRKVLVTGGAGYVGSALVPRLLDAGHSVNVLDLYLYGDDVLEPVAEHPGLRQIRGDIRSPETVRDAIEGCDTVIHLACISNDPSFELDPKLGKSINYDAFRGLVDAAEAEGIDRFVYASSSSVYGIKEEENVTEDLPLEPLTDYSMYKAECERVLLERNPRSFTGIVLRPATVCGFGRRLRLDLTVNLLANHGYHNRLVKVFGGSQRRPNIHIDDVCELYFQSLEWPAEAVDGRIYNAGYENHRISDIAAMVRDVMGDDIEIATTPTDDLRSYHISSERIEQELGFVPRRTIEDAIRDLHEAFETGKVPDPFDDARYYNIETMRNLELLQST